MNGERGDNLAYYVIGLLHLPLVLVLGSFVKKTENEESFPGILHFIGGGAKDTIIIIL